MLAVDQCNDLPVGRDVQRRINLFRRRAVAQSTPAKVVDGRAGVRLLGSPQGLAIGGVNSHDMRPILLQSSNDYLAILDQQLGRAYGLLVGLQYLAGTRVQFRYGCFEPQCDIDSIVDSNQCLAK